MRTLAAVAHNLQEADRRRAAFPPAGWLGRRLSAAMSGSAAELLLIMLINPSSAWESSRGGHDRSRNTPSRGQEGSGAKGGSGIESLRSEAIRASAVPDVEVLSSPMSWSLFFGLCRWHENYWEFRVLVWWSQGWQTIIVHYLWSEVYTWNVECICYLFYYYFILILL